MSVVLRNNHSNLHNYPRLFGDFCILSVEERVTWRYDLARSIIAGMTTKSGFAIAEWKLEEQLQPLNCAIREHILCGLTSPEKIKGLFAYEQTAQFDI